MLAQFKSDLMAMESEEILKKYFLGEHAQNVTPEQIERIRSELSLMFSVPKDLIDIVITGSAKIGFALFEKKTKTGTILPRFRPFSYLSDIDVAVISEPIYSQIWRDLSLYAHSMPRFPWRSEKLGDYKIVGWIRPDHWPSITPLGKCKDWWTCFSKLSRDPFFGRRKIRGGLFNSRDFLKQYLNRSIDQCRDLESTE